MVRNIRSRRVVVAMIFVAASLAVTAPSVSGTCPDGDDDGFCAAVDCDDTNPYCTTDCTDSDADGICDEHDNCVEVANPNQGGPTKLNEPYGDGQGVSAFVVTPDSGTVVFTADQDVANRFDLHRAPIFGEGVTTQLNPPMAADREVKNPAVSPDL